MNPTDLRTEQPRQVVAELSRGKLMVSIAIVSFAALLLELSLTRLFSVVLFYHFAFLSISVALLGLGGGGVFAYVRRSTLARYDLRQLGTSVCLINAISMVGVLWTVLHTRAELGLTYGNFFRLTAMYLTAAVPFFFTGLLFSVVFARESRRVTSLYGADLVGAACACLLTVPLLNLVGGPNAVLAAAFSMGVAGVLWAGTTGLKAASMSAAVLLLALIAFNHSGSIFDIIYAKGLYRDPQSVEFARWNAISRIEVDRWGMAKAIVIDADAATYIMNADPHSGQATEGASSVMSAAPSVVNVLRPEGDFAIIGPGGGVDVLRAVANGSQNVTGIEINPIIANDVMRGRYAEYAYHLYERPEVHIHVSDGRSFVRNSRDRYDVVQMTLVDTWASTAAGAFALSENSLYTVEAFREYFEHLKPDGMVAITRWEFKNPREALRVVSVAMETLRSMGVGDVSQHFFVVSDGLLNEDGRPVLVLAKKSPFTHAEERGVLEHLERNPNLALIYSPWDHTRSAGVHPVDTRLRWNPFTALIVSNDAHEFAEKYAYNVGPVHDDAPFFFFTMKLGQMFGTGSGLQRGIDWKVNLGVVVLGMVLLISLLAVAVFLILPLALHAPSRGESVWRLLYFVLVGLGYIVVEIALIQRFVLFLGHPTYALTVVVFLMLLSSGIGSLLSRRWLENPRNVWRVAVVIAVALAAYVIVLPRVLAMGVGLPFTAKLVVSACLLAPLGLAMGMPFPSGLRALSAAGESGGSVEWAWAMNAASSVLGSVLAMVITIQWGLSVTLAFGAVTYMAAAALTRTFPHWRVE
ncbi:MAG TPA: hypothetical protein VN622_03410 [Clostridia bacterium]|nr:hypothetical protein [Clostridia bacterium]